MSASQNIDKGQTMDHAIERLRASRNRSLDALCAKGSEMGREWVISQAEADELERLADYRESAGNDWDRLFWEEASSAYGCDEQLYFVLQPEDDGNRDAAESFWERAVSAENESLTRKPGFVKAFAEGALEAWDEISPQL